MATPAVDADLHQRALRVWRERACADFGCEDAAFDSHALTIATRPPESKRKYIARVLSLGTGTVLSVEESWLDFVRTLTFEKHFLAFQPQELMVPVINEAGRRGIEVIARSAGLWFLPAQMPAAPIIPQGTQVERWEREQCAPWAATFHNALGESDGDGDDFLYALALVDGDGQPQAMAGAWHESKGLVEIGVDVAREARGQGFGPVVVRSVARRILESDNIPTYNCAAANIRSQRTALASGFVPVISSGGVRPKPQQNPSQPP
jgi:RimJ/RimL family protein N-acetyltransferase